MCGLAIVLHGSFRDRCALLFTIFNLGNDEGVSRAELRTMLTAIMQSTNTILYSVGDQDSAVIGSQDIGATVDAMVESAFTNCDISRTGKLLPMASYTVLYWVGTLCYTVLHYVCYIELVYGDVLISLMHLIEGLVFVGRETNYVLLRRKKSKLLE